MECDNLAAQDQHEPKQPPELSDMVSVVPVAVTGMSTVCFVAGMVLALLAVPARDMFMMLMPTVPHGSFVACVMIRVGGGGLGGLGLGVSRMAGGVGVAVVVAWNHAGSR